MSNSTNSTSSASDQFLAVHSSLAVLFYATIHLPTQVLGALYLVALLRAKGIHSKNESHSHQQSHPRPPDHSRQLFFPMPYIHLRAYVHWREDNILCHIQFRIYHWPVRQHPGHAPPLRSLSMCSSNTVSRSSSGTRLLAIFLHLGASLWLVLSLLHGMLRASDLQMGSVNFKATVLLKCFIFSSSVYPGSYFLRVCYNHFLCC